MRYLVFGVPTVTIWLRPFLKSSRPSTLASIPLSAEKGIKKNFGWKDTVKDCTDYKAGGTAIVDPSCKVEIPKTGDASVVAYAVMALVAAAGAMGLKK